MSHRFNRPLAVRHLPPPDERYGFKFVAGFFIGLGFSIAIAFIGIVGLILITFWRY